MFEKLKNRLKRLEKKAHPEPQQQIEVIMWNSEKGGLWGISRISPDPTRDGPLPIQQELKVLYRWYIGQNMRYSRHDPEPIKFSEYLERTGFLGLKKYARERARVIQQLREGET